MENAGEIMLIIILAIAGLIPGILKSKRQKNKSVVPSETPATSGNKGLDRTWRALLEDDPFDFGETPKVAHRPENKSVESAEIRDMRRAGSLEAKYAIDNLRHEESLESKYINDRPGSIYNNKQDSSAFKGYSRNRNLSNNTTHISSNKVATDYTTGLSGELDNTSQEHENMIMDDFDIRKAIVYSEIMRPKFQE